MKHIIKLIVLSFMMNYPIVVKAQIKAGDMIKTEFNLNDIKYIGEATSGSTSSFSCRFLHSQSKYTFNNLKRVPDSSQYLMTGVVASNIGGKYKAGSTIRFNVYRPDYKKIITSADFKKMRNSDHFIVKFSDGKNYLAGFGGISELNIITLGFLHTRSIYQIDSEGTIVQSGGKYKPGDKVSFHPATLMTSAAVLMPIN